MPINSPSILVLGGAGYIGSHMVLALQQAGYHPVVLDNLVKGHKQAVHTTEFIVGDIADKALLQTLFAQYRFVAVMHFASFIEIAESVSSPLKYYQNNVTATINLLDVMLLNNVKNIIFSSSAAVYGEPTTSPIAEIHPLNPINPYGRGKLMVETILKDCATSGGINYAILRYFNAAGADPLGRIGEYHDPESHLIPVLLQVAAGRRPNITIYGDQYPTADGTCVRDYVHVSDICQAHLLALQALMSGRQNILYNLGNGRGYSVQEVIRVVRNITKHAIPTVIGNPRTGDPAILIAEATRAHQELKWQPQYSKLNTIVQHAWAACKRNNSKIS